MGQRRCKNIKCVFLPVPVKYDGIRKKPRSYSGRAAEMRKYDSVLFDLDGTLTDSGPGIMRSAAYAMNEMKIIQTSDESLRVFVGPPLKDTFMRFGVPKDRVDEAIALYRKCYNAGAKFENIPYPGIEDLLGKLKEEGFRLFVATSKPEELAVEILKHFSMDGYFEVIAGATKDYSRERKDQVLAWLLQTADVGNAVMVGDTEYDVSGAKEHGLPCIGVSWGYGTVGNMRNAGALQIVNTMEELHGALQG